LVLILSVEARSDGGEAKWGNTGIVVAGGRQEEGGKQKRNGEGVVAVFM